MLTAGCKQQVQKILLKSENRTQFRGKCFHDGMVTKPTVSFPAYTAIDKDDNQASKRQLECNSNSSLVAMATIVQNSPPHGHRPFLPTSSTRLIDIEWRTDIKSRSSFLTPDSFEDTPAIAQVLQSSGKSLLVGNFNIHRGIATLTSFDPQGNNQLKRYTLLSERFSIPLCHLMDYHPIPQL